MPAIIIIIIMTAVVDKSEVIGGIVTNWGF